MTKIQEEYREKILEDFEVEQKQERSHLPNYFIETNLRNLITNIGDF